MALVNEERISIASSSTDVFHTPSRSKLIGCKIDCRRMLNIIWKGLVTLFLVLLCVVIYIYIVDKKQKAVIKAEGLKCYECTNMVNVNITEPGLPYEKKCYESPHNIRQCLPAQVCFVSVVGFPKKARITRGCTSTSKTGCISVPSPFRGKICTCQENLCVS